MSAEIETFASSVISYGSETREEQVPTGHRFASSVISYGSETQRQIVGSGHWVALGVR